MHNLTNALCTDVFQAEEEFASSFIGLSISVVATFGFTFFLSSFVIFPITERESKVLYTTFTVDL